MRNNFPDGTSLEYVGLFLDRKELYSRLRTVPRTPLSRAAPFPHMTFAYRPAEISRELFGVRAEILCVGYGCDNGNEGLLAEVKSDNAELMRAFHRIAVPHITLTLSEGAKAVNTRNLAFRPISPFTVTGIYGGFIKEKGRVIIELSL